MSGKIRPSLQSNRSPVSWENIKEESLKSDQLDSDIRVSDNKIYIEPTEASSIWKKIKMFFCYDTTSTATKEETVRNLKSQLTAYFITSIAHLIDETGIDQKKENCEELVRSAEALLEKITARLDTDVETRGISTSQAIQEAHGAAQRSLIELRQQFSKPDKTPQIIPLENGKYSLIRPAAAPENLVLAGGGVKGVGYVGAYRALESSGALRDLKRLAGSSAGAMSAALIAGGLNADEFQRASENTSFWDILVKPSNNTAALETDLAATSIGFSGGYAENKINQELSASVKKFLNTPEVNISGLDNEQEKKEMSNLKAALNPKLTFWQKYFSFSKPKNQPVPITFGHLAILHKMDPSKFKELTITGFDETAKQEKYYNVGNSRDMPIAKAVRISMSLPLAFKPVEVNGDRIEDGGIGDNEPADVFKGDYEKTLVLGFDNEGKFNHVLFDGETKVPSSWSEYFYSLLSGNKNLAASETADNERLYDAGPNALDVYHGDLDTVSFLANEKRMKAAQRQAEVRMDEQMVLRQNQAVSEVYDDLESAQESLTEEELKAIEHSKEVSNDIKKEVTEELEARLTWTFTNS